jgi:lysozyme
MNLRISKKGIDLIKHFEHFETAAYQDSAGIWTVGYGTTMIDGKKVKQGDAVNEIYAYKLLSEYANRDARKLNNLCNLFGITLNQDQFDSLLSFTYNGGFGMLFKTNKKGKGVASALWEAIRADSTPESTDAYNAFLRYVFYRDPKTKTMKVSRGLRRRRQAERYLYATGLLKYEFME